MNTNTSQTKTTGALQVVATAAADTTVSDKVLLKENLAAIISQEITKRLMTQGEASKFLGIQQSRVSEIMNGKINNFSLDMLFDLMNAFGVRASIRTKNLENLVTPRGTIAITNIIVTRKGKKTVAKKH
jgi:predicted XRE-type DNA-binding protein